MVDLVVVQVNVPQPVQQCRVADLGDVVEAGVEGLEVEAITEGVIVANLVDLVVMDIQPLQ